MILLYRSRVFLATFYGRLLIVPIYSHFLSKRMLIFFEPCNYKLEFKVSLGAGHGEVTKFWPITCTEPFLSPSPLLSCMKLPCMVLA